MSNPTDLRSHLETIRDEVLPSLGVQDSTVRNILSARLLIERLGETDANYWWDSRVLSSFGKETLEETVPRTSTQSQITLAMKVGRKAERNAIDEPSVSLFDLGPHVESQIQREVEEVGTDQELTVLEECSIDLTEGGWTESLSEGEIDAEPGVGKPYQLGATEIENLETKEALDDIVAELIQGYGASTKNNLRVPYYRVDE